MADILIRGMEIPKTCCQCDLKIYDPEIRWDENGIEQIGAWVCKRTREIIWNTQRGENCPLLPAADVVEVVRCKDCVHDKPNDQICPIPWVKRTLNSFCSFGERRADNG